MFYRHSLIFGAWFVALAAPVHAQDVKLPAGYAPGSAIGFGAPDSDFVPVTPATPLPVAAKQEAVMLVTGNTAAAPQGIYGGTYAAGVTCAGYNGGAVAIRTRGPDGATMLTLYSVNANGTFSLALGSGAVVDATLPIGSTGCNSSLARVP